jgi:hypothetical protein
MDRHLKLPAPVNTLHRVALSVSLARSLAQYNLLHNFYTIPLNQPHIYRTYTAQFDKFKRASLHNLPFSVSAVPHNFRFFTALKCCLYQRRQGFWFGRQVTPNVAVNKYFELFLSFDDNRTIKVEISILLLQQIISVIIILQMMADRNFERISSIM